MISSDAGGCETSRRGAFKASLPGRVAGLLWKLWRHPAASVASIGLGLLLGLRYPELARTCEPLGLAYAALLAMAVLPQLVTALVTALARLIRRRGATRLLGRASLVLCLGLVLAAAFGMAMSILLRPGERLGLAEREQLGRFILREEMAADQGRVTSDLVIEQPQASVGESSRELWRRFAPSNVYADLVRERGVPVVLACLLFATALGHLRGAAVVLLLRDAEVVFRGLSTINRWVRALLPLGMPFLVGARAARVGFELVQAMLPYLLVVNLTCVCMLVASGLLLGRRSGQGFFRSFGRLKDALFIALSTQSDFLAIPSAMAGMRAGLGFDGLRVRLLIPLGVSLCRFGSVAVVAQTSLFFAQLYGVEVGPRELLLTGALSILAVTASTASRRGAELLLLGLPLGSLDVSVEATLVWILAVYPILDPLMIAVNVHCNCAAAAFLVERPTSARGESDHPMDGEDFYCSASTPSLR